MENNIKNIIYHLKAYIILNGYPFADIENEDLNCICYLQSRATLVRDIEKLASLTKQKIKRILDSASVMSIAVDEWQDKMKRRYLGVTASKIIERQYRTFTLAHRPMHDVHCDAKVIRKHIREILDEYNVTNKIKCAVTDNGGSIPCAFTDDYTSEENMDLNLNIKRFPCICHIINIYARTFQKIMKSDLNEFIQIRNAFDTPCFTAYLANNECKIRRISSYTEVRWSSLSNMLNDMVFLKKYMIKYNEMNKYEPIPDDFWMKLNQWQKIFNTFAKCIKAVEGNGFGLISKSLPCIRRIQQALRLLPDRFSVVLIEINKKMENHWNKYKENWTPILHVCARLNPYINHTKILTPNELALADHTIKMLMRGKQNHISVTNVNEEYDDDFNFMRNSQGKNADAFNEYLISLGIIDEEGDLLNYWIQKLDSNWRKLAEIALDFLSIPSSSSTAERQFSIIGETLGLRRLKMIEDHVEDSTIILLNQKIARPILESMIKQ